MPNRNYANGRAKEYQTIAALQACGYSASRAAGSHGPWDVIAWNDKEIVFIQVKSNCRPSAAEWKAMLAEVVPPNGKKFVYLYRFRKPLETIEVGKPCPYCRDGGFPLVGLVKEGLR